jgi:hypothetical protein
VPDTIRPVRDGQKANFSLFIEQQNWNGEELMIRRGREEIAVNAGYLNRVLNDLFLGPVDVVAELGMKTLYVKAKHPVHAQLAQLSRVAGSEGIFLFVAQVVFAHHGFEIR